MINSVFQNQRTMREIPISYKPKESLKESRSMYKEISEAINVGNAIFVIILVNTFTITKYINRATKYVIEHEVVYLSIGLGMLYSVVLSGRLNLIKNISLS